MQRLLLSLLAVSLVSGLIGCHSTRGVCDCATDFDEPCAFRAPLANGAGAARANHQPADNREAVPAPAPNGKKL